MRTVVDSQMEAAQSRRAKELNKSVPQLESTLENWNRRVVVKSRKKKTIVELLSFLRKGGKKADEVEVNFECVHKQVWSNTNRLLRNDRNYVGIKTGITKNAGWCLSSQKKKKNMALTCSKTAASGNCSFVGNNFFGKTLQRNRNDSRFVFCVPR